MNDDMKDALAGAISLVLVAAMVVLSFMKPESAIALCLLAIAIFKGMERS